MHSSALSIALLGDAGSPHLARLAADLAGRGHRITVLTPDTKAPAPLRLEVKVVSYRGTASLLARARAVHKALNELRPDVLHSHFINTGGYPAVASGFHPHVMTVWGSDALLLPQRSTAARLQTALALRSADWVLSPAEALREVITRLSGRRARNEVLPWGVDTAHFSRRQEAGELRRALAPADHAVVLSLRSLTPLYNQHVLFEAWAEVRKVYPRSILVVSRYLADPAYEASLREQADRLGIAGSLRWIEPVSYDELPLYYAAADLLVSIPSSDAPALTILEALACETPVIASDLPAVRQWLTPGVHGDLVQPESAAEVAASLKQMLAMKDDERACLGKAGRELVGQRADRGRSLDRLEAIYQTLAASRGEGSSFSYLRTLRTAMGMQAR